VQSAGVNWDLTTEMLLDNTKIRQQKHRFGKQSYTVTISRVIPRSGSFFYSSATHPLLTTLKGPIPPTKDISLIYGPDSQSHISKNDQTISKITYNDSILTSISYSIKIDGPITENLTFQSHSYTKSNDTINLNSTLPQNGATIRRQDISFSGGSASTLPTEVLNAFNIGNSIDGKPVYGLQSIEINIEMNYRDLLDNGTWNRSSGTKQFKLVEVPISVTSSFIGVMRSHYDESRPNIDPSYYDTNRTIDLKAVVDGSVFRWNLGTDNYLTGFDFSGGDTEGGNVEATLSYQNDSSDFYFTKS
jgi:hypothetical protein